MCRREMLKHRGELSLAAAGEMFGRGNVLAATSAGLTLRCFCHVRECLGSALTNHNYTPKILHR